MTRYEQIAQKAIAARLEGAEEPVTLFTLSCVADTSVRDAGKKRDLYESLYPYENLLPPGWCPKWCSADGCSDSLLYAVPDSWKPGTPAKSLLMGNGALRPV